jgi:hypothetical protein
MHNIQGLSYTSYKLAWYWLWWSGLWTHALVLDILLRPSSSIEHPQNVVRKGTLTQLNINHVIFGIGLCLITWLDSSKEIALHLSYEFFNLKNWSTWARSYYLQYPQLKICSIGCCSMFQEENWKATQDRLVALAKANSEAQVSHLHSTYTFSRFADLSMA